MKTKEWLINKRNDLNLTQKKLSEKSGVNILTIQAI